MNRKKPYNIAITFNNDATTEMNFVWNTSEDVVESKVEIWEAGGNVQTFTGKPYVREGFKYHPHHGLGRPEIVPPTTPEHIQVFAVHKITVSSLIPDTKYEYKLGGDSEFAYGSFKTGKASGGFSFVYLADAQAYSDKNFAAFNRTAHAALCRVPHAGFVVMPGDMVDIGNSEELWCKFFNAADTMCTCYPIVPAIGNHETDLYHSTFTDHFNFPKSKSPYLPDYVYTFDYGGARFVVLSTEHWCSHLETDREKTIAFMDAQKQLLRSAFSPGCDKWKIVVMHKALYTSGSYTPHSNTAMYKQIFEPLFDELGVNAVLQGHDHTFVKAFVRGGKAVPLINETTAKTHDGTFYLLSNASGEKFYDPVLEAKDLPLLKYDQPRLQMYTVVHVTEDNLRFETYVITEKGEALYDEFLLQK